MTSLRFSVVGTSDANSGCSIEVLVIEALDHLASHRIVEIR